MSLSIRKLHPCFAAEVAGVDLRVPLDENLVREVRGAIDRYAVLVFHGEPLTQEQQVNFARSIGTVETPSTLKRKTGEHRFEYREISDAGNVNAQGEIRASDDRFRMYSLANRLWHTDGSFRRVPAELSMLSAHRVPPERGGETEFADLRAAYDALPERTKAEIEKLQLEHSVTNSRAFFGWHEFSDEERAALPPIAHPLVRVHPGSKRKTLYMGSHASHVVGWAVADGRALLYELTDFATQREFVYKHAWQVGDFVIWDNRCTLHRGKPFDERNEARDLRRVSTRDLSFEGAPA